MNNQTRTLIQQIIVLVIFFAAVALLINFAFNFIQPPEGQHYVTYRVRGNGGAAIISYTKTDGTSTGPLDVSLPWNSPRLTIPTNTTIILTAANPASLGTLECIIELDGEEWRRDSTSNPGDRIACGGTVR